MKQRTSKIILSIVYQTEELWWKLYLLFEKTNTTQIPFLFVDSTQSIYFYVHARLFLTQLLLLAETFGIFFFFFFFFFLLFGIVGVRVHFPGWRGWGIGVKASATVAGSQQGNEVWNGIARLISKCSRKWNSICCTAKEHRSTGLKTG